MEDRFQLAFKWHYHGGDATFAQIARSASVSENVLKKLNSRERYGARVDDAVRIAWFYGKSVESFMLCEAVDKDTQFLRLIDLLTDDEKRSLLAQMRGLLAGRE